MSTIDVSFLKTGSKWSPAEILSLQYSFPLSNPLYYLGGTQTGIHTLSFVPFTEGQISFNSDPLQYDQQDIIRYFLSDPNQILSFSGDQTVNVNLVNTVNKTTPDGVVNYRVSFAEVINASISESTSGVGEIIVMNQDRYNAEDPSLAYIPSVFNQSLQLAGDVFINALDSDAINKLAPGEYGFWLHIHELGHAIGGLEDVRETSQANTYLDNQKYTMMSYNPYGLLGGVGAVATDTEVYASGLQLLDIVALQETYSTTNTATRSGDTVYSLGQGLGFAGAAANDAFLYTIWDGGGDDSIVYNIEGLQSKVSDIYQCQNSCSLVETYLSGTEYTVGVFESSSNGKLMAMPIEIIPEKNKNGDRILDFNAKENDTEKVIKVKDLQVHELVSDLAIKAFRALKATSHARIDVKMDEHGVPHFLEGNLMPGLSKGYFYRSCALNKKMSYEDMLYKITDNALAQRY